MSTVKITILSDKMRGTSFSLTNEQYTIGRSDTADICIPDPTISGHHCTLLRIGEDAYAIKDEGSTNGTRVNGEKLTDEVVNLQNGDLLQVGNVEMLFENADAHHAEIRSMTVINLDDTGTVDVSNSGLRNLGLKTSSKKPMTLRENKKHNTIFMALIAILGIAAIGAIIVLIMSLK